MNKIHSTVWSQARRAYVVAHEKAATGGRPSSIRTMTAAVAAAVLALAGGEALAACDATGYSSSTQVLDNGHCLEISGTVAPSTNNGPGVEVISGSDITNGGAIETSGLNGNGINIGPGHALSGTLQNNGLIVSHMFLDGSSLGTNGIMVNAGTVGSVVNSATSVIISDHGAGIQVQAGGTINNGVTNSGEISGGKYGIRVESQGQIFGGITNSGTLSGTQAGIGIHGGTPYGQFAPSLFGSITNQAGGQISAWNNGIDIFQAVINGGITNEAGGTISGQDGDGIHISAQSTIIGDITNSGTITGNDVYSAGIRIEQGSSVQGNIVNNGEINANTGIFIRMDNTVSGNIQNSSTGRITMTGDNGGGIVVDWTSTVQGSIANNGTIVAAPDSNGTMGSMVGIYVKDGSTVNYGVNNYGTIQLGGDNSTGIAIDSATIGSGGGGVANYGVINDGGTSLSGGISIRNGAFVHDEILNAETGTIDVGHGGFGIGVFNSSVAGIINFGRISTLDDGTGIRLENASLGGNITNFGPLNGGISGIALTSNTVVHGDIINGGTIAGDNTSSGAGILIEGATLTGSIANYQLIRGQGTDLKGGIVVGYFDDGAHAASEIGQGITNYGTITGGYYGIGLGNGAAVNGGIVNNGYIYGDSRAIRLDWGSMLTEGLVNNGRIESANVAIKVGSASGFPTSLLAGGITNTGTIAGSDTGIAVVDNGAISGGLTNSGTISGGNYAINVDGTSSLDSIHIRGNDTALFVGDVVAPNTPTFVDSGAVYTLQNGNQFTVSSFTNNGTLKIGEGSTAAITGNLVNTGTFSPAVASMTNYGKINVSGSATLGGVAYVNVIGTPTLTVGSTLTGVIHATGGVSGQFAGVGDNSALYDFKGVYAANDFGLKIVAAGDNGGPTVLGSAQEHNNTPGLGAARVLDQVVVGNDPAWARVRTALGQLSTTQQVSQAVSQTLPLLTGSSIAAANSALSGVNRVIQARIEANRGLSSGEEFFNDGNVWAKPFGSWARQDNSGGVAGYKATTAGLALGIDRSVTARTRVGFALAYANASVTGQSDVAPNSAKVDLYQLISYGSYSLDATREINWQVDVGNNRNEGSRQIRFLGETARSTYNSLTAHAGVGLGWSYALGEQTRWLPSVRADYTWIRDAGYTEHGADALNLKVDGRTTDQLLLAADGKVSHQLADGLAVMGNLGVGYDALSKRAAMTSAFAGEPGQSFVTYGVSPKPWLARAGLGISKSLKNGPEVTARYDLELREGFNNQTASVKLRWNF